MDFSQKKIAQSSFVVGRSRTAIRKSFVRQCFQLNRIDRMIVCRKRQKIVITFCGVSRCENRIVRLYGQNGQRSLCLDRLQRLPLHSVGPLLLQPLLKRCLKALISPRFDSSLRQAAASGHVKFTDGMLLPVLLIQSNLQLHAVKPGGCGFSGRGVTVHQGGPQVGSVKKECCLTVCRDAILSMQPPARGHVSIKRFCQFVTLLLHGRCC